MKKLSLLSLTMVVVGGMWAHAGGVLLTYAESPGQQTTTLSNASWINFDNAFVGSSTAQTNFAWSGVGTYDSISIIPANQYGGAGGSGYYAVQSQSVGAKVVTTTLTLDTPSSYFGLWWSAGDAKNRMQFYSGASLVADFSTQVLLNVLPTTYSGNPNPSFLGQNSGERYAFLNIYSNSGTTFDRIVFSNDGSSGFESDNHTVRAAAWGTLPGEDGPPPGIPVANIDGTTVSTVAVPETETWLMGFVAFALVLFAFRRRPEMAR